MSRQPDYLLMENLEIADDGDADQHVDIYRDFMSPEIYDKWMSAGGPSGLFGRPKAAAKATVDEKSRFVEFTTDGLDVGAIFATTTTPGKAVSMIYGPIWRKWKSTGGEDDSSIGYPVTDLITIQTANGQSRYCDFGFDGIPSASICWNSHQGAHVISGEIWAKWKSVGAYESNYGLPVID